MTTAPTIDDPVGEFTDLPPDVQQGLLTLYGCLELMLPEERLSCATTHSSVAIQLEAWGLLPLTRKVSLEVIDLLTMAAREEQAADERNGL
jgi:hypothetical protein